MDQFKAWCTRNLKKARGKPESHPASNWWTQRGSKRWINDEERLAIGHGVRARGPGSAPTRALRRVRMERPMTCASLTSRRASEG